MADRSKISQLSPASESLQCPPAAVCEDFKTVDEARLAAIAEFLCTYNTETKASTLSLLRKTYPDIPISREFAIPPHFHLRPVVK